MRDVSMFSRKLLSCSLGPTKALLLHSRRPAARASSIGAATACVLCQEHAAIMLECAQASLCIDQGQPYELEVLQLPELKSNAMLVFTGEGKP